MNLRTKSPFWFGVLPSFRLLMASAVMTLPVFAQVEDEDEPEDDEIIELSPFQVTTERDSGYMTTNSTAGTSLNMLIRDIPLSLEVINREMLDDMQATNLEESLIYSAGVFTDNYVANSTANPGFRERSPSAVGNYNDPFQNTISIRGYNVPNQQRAGFRVGFIHPNARIVLGGSTDSITTERTEIVRGPQSLLYGINVLSGVTNIEPKRPLSEFSGNTSVMFGSDSQFRATLDVTGPVIKDKLNYRVMAAHHSFDDDNQVNFREYERQTFDIQFQYYITPKTELFVEFVQANRESRGIGPQTFATSSNTNIRDIWGEAFNFGRDDPTVPLWVPYSPNGEVFDIYFQDHDMSDYGGEGKDGVNDGPLVQNPAHEQFYDFTDLGYNFNISGPDTFRNQKETNILAQLYHSFSENLNLELGFYHSEVEIDERNLQFTTFWDNTNVIVPQLPNPIPILDRNWIDWQQNPEVMAANGATDKVGYGIGELFSFGIIRQEVSPTNSSWWVTISDPPLEADVALDTGRPLPRVYGLYHWYDKPASSKSNQARGRLAYQLDTEFFDIPATHTFVAGFHLIEDSIQFVTGNGLVDQFYSPGPTNALKTSPYEGKVAIDPIYFRQSVFDTTPIRLRPDDKVATAGNINYNDLGGLSPRPRAGQGDPSAIARSGWRDDTLWFRGFYGIYRGQFWNDKLTIIGGIRHDSYQGRESEELVIIDRDRETFNWTGANLTIHDPTRPGILGDKPWVYDPRYSDEKNAAIADSITRLRFTQDENGEYTIPNKINGTREHLYDESQTFTTNTFGVSYRIFEPLSVYVAYSEGVFPNVGERDGADDPIGPEQSESKEIGFRFDLFEGKLSGTISFWRIHRTNAVTDWDYAPNPRNFYGNVSENSSPDVDFLFSPLNTYENLTVQRPEGSIYPGGNLQPGDPNASPYRGGQYWPLNYGVDVRYIELAMEQLGYAPPEYGTSAPQIGDFEQFNQNGEIVNVFDRGLNISTGAGQGRVVIAVIDHDKALRDTDPDTNVLKRALELAREGAQVHGPPVVGDDAFSGPLVDYNGAGIIWYSFSDPPLNNPSATHFTDGAVPVTFEEEGEGIDGQLIYAPIPNWQIVLTFSHQERGLVGKGLNLVDPIGLDDQGNLVNWGTEYDVWVYLLGIENFEDPTRPSTYNGESVRGLDLSYVPQDSMGLLTRYSFRDNFLDGLTIGGGVQYEGEVATATPIGGTRLDENRYLPPDRPERLVWNTFLRYNWDMANIRWGIQLNINNLFDHTEDFVVANYVSDTNVPIVRRTLVRYPPRSWRIALNARF